VKPLPLPINRPEQITFEAAPVLYAAVSHDGKWLAYASGREDFADLWVRSADPELVVVPRRLTDDPAHESAPAFSLDGQYLAYVGTSHDSKGDIYLLDLKEEGAESKRLTDRDTADGAPCFAPDGKTLYFHQSRAGENGRRIVALDLEKWDEGAKRVEGLGGDGAFPAVSPDGQQLAFVSFHSDPGGDLFFLDLSSSEVLPLTSGSQRDLFPTWSPDGSYIYFARFALDTDRDGAVTLRDNAAIYRIRSQDRNVRAFPLTSAASSSFQPMVTATNLLFLSSRGDVSNVWTLPLDGTIPSAEGASQQMDLALELSLQFPPDPYLELLGYYRVLEHFSDKEVLAARAGYKIGGLYLEMGFAGAAERAFEHVADAYARVIPEAALATIDLITTQSRQAWQESDTEAERRRVMETGLSQVEAVASRYQGVAAIQGRARVVQARLLLDFGMDSASILKATDLAGQVVEKYPSEHEQAAEALLLQADAYQKVGSTEMVLPAYVRVMDEYPQEEKWADLAVDRILELAVADISVESDEDQVKVLREVAQKNRDSHPRLAMGALNRIGDILFAAGQWAEAKQAYKQVLDEFQPAAPVTEKPAQEAPYGGTTQGAAARLALAEVLYREERFRQALDLYETEISARPYEDYIYQLAREGYIRKSLAAGEHLTRLGEVASARSIFKDLIREDPNIVEAHRGYIKCSAALREIQFVLGEYRQQLGQDPEDPIVLYATALCLTYLDREEALEEAQALIQRAIEHQGQIEYFHQTLGYVFEVLETVHGREGSLELAVESYQRAYFLNDHRNNPTNAANLLLNLGNAHFLLAQYVRAFQYYEQRLTSEVPFDNEETEILYYERLGASAFQVGDPSRPIEAFRKALDLIDDRIHPTQASGALDAMNRYIMDRLVTPALREPGLEAAAKDVAQRQSDINRRLADLTQMDVHPPPDPSWESYRAGLEGLLSEQEGLNADAVSLAEDLGQEPQEAREKLTFMISRVQTALRSPQRFIQLKAELLDRLGLAYQEAGRFKEAREAFEAVFKLNSELGLNQNLAANRRSVAYNTYMLANERSGDAREALLREAAEDFEAVVELVQKHGVAGKERVEGGRGMISLTFDVSLDKVGSTQAMYGFSPEQEERLAEAFLSRIHIELGQLGNATEAVRQQLTTYTGDTSIPDKDLYGVALLYHRAGQLAAAQKRWKEGFEHFRRSADLSLRMGNPTIAATNVTNMAHALTRISLKDPQVEQYIGDLARFDRETTALLERYPPASGAPVLAAYHNAMGVHWSNMPIVSAGSTPSPVEITSTLEGMVRSADAIQQATIHFSRGLRWFEGEGKIWNDRQSLSLRAALHMNLSKVSLHLNEAPQAAEHLRAALLLARSALLPEVEWRALAGLGRLGEALDVLTSQSVLRAGCEPQEITTAFHPLVAELVREDQSEAAFNLAEQLSELERVNRMVPLLLREMPAEEKRLYREIYPRLERIRTLRARLEVAEGEGKVLLSKDLELEEGLMVSQMERAPAGTQSSVLSRFAGRRDLREQLMLLIGLAFHTEEVADAYVEVGDEKNAEALLSEHQALAERYDQVTEGLSGAMPPGEAAGLPGFFVPQAVQAIDVMGNLPENVQLIRLFGAADTRGALIEFTVTSGEIMARAIESYQQLNVPFDETTYLAYEEPGRIPVSTRGSLALSATHLVRSFWNRKPFKRSLLVVSAEGQYDASSLTDLPGFDVRSVAGDAASEAFLEALPVTHTLVLGSRVDMVSSVPTREGERPRSFLSMDLNDGQRFPLTRLMGRLTSLSLALMPLASPDEAYLIGNLFSILGCPTVLIPQDAQSSPPSVRVFLERYASTSISGALDATQPGLEGQASWLQLGYMGMTPLEAAAFAEANFVRLVQEAMAAFQNAEYLRALALLENARLIALDVESYHQHLPNIYVYSRESAYAAGDLAKALENAQALVDLLETKQPGTQAHAEALLRLGLLQAKLENYEQEKGAIPTLERVVEILSHLQLAPDQAAALSDLGVVLENATEYDRALVKFEAAAELSRSLNQHELLASQHVNIGRIYDLRLSQYALAKQSYEKALAIYRELGDTGGVAQSLIDIGRCYRLLGNFGKADDHYAEALELIKDNPENMQLRAKALIEQANNAWFQARYQEAFDLRLTAYRLALGDEWLLGQIIALNTSGLIWWTLGENDKALRELDEALALARKLETRRDEVATTLNNMGVVYREMGRYQDAMDAFEKALSIDRELRSRWAIAYDLRNQGLTLIRMGQAQKAISLLEEAVAEAHAIGDRVNEAKALLGLGEAQLAVDQNAEAAVSFESALELSVDLALRETQWRALYGLAKLSLRSGSKSEARVTLMRAVEVIEGMRADIKVDRLKDGFLINKMEVYESLVILLLDMGNQVEAFNVAERSRARNFIDLLGNQRLSLHGTVDQDLYDRHRTLRSRIEEYEALVAQSTEEPERKAYEQALLRELDAYQDLLVEMQAKNPQLAAMVSVDPLGLSELQSLLESGIALLAYYVVPDEVICWVIKGSGVETLRTPLGRTLLGQTVLDYRRMTQNLEPVEETSQLLFEDLLSAVMPRLEGVQYLGIVPHGFLHYLSFATLWDGQAYLIDRVSLFYLPSASVLRYTLERRVSDKNVRVLAVGNPNLGDPALELPFAEREIGTIRWNFPNITTLTRDKATESWVTEHIGEFGIIHMASHGEFDPINPLFSAVKLARDENRDGNLEAGEVFNLEINADLVLLSACQTALGKVTSGDDIIGLNRSFFYAGTHALMSSLWLVSDVSTAMLIKHFYRAYVRSNKADSLRDALLHTRNWYPHPGYWGAFILVGDYY
jgi:CHAT domain-containing protein/Tol biopolymer transport system component/Tfp pilus assembly protein PilF